MTDGSDSGVLRQSTVDSRKFQYGSGTLYTGCPSLFKALDMEDGHIPTFWLLLQCRKLIKKPLVLYRALDRDPIMLGIMNQGVVKQVAALV